MTGHKLPRCKPDIAGVLLVFSVGFLFGGTVMWWWLI